MGLPRPVLLVEDDPALRATLVEQLAEDGTYNADQAGSVSEAQQRLASTNTHYDAILLDVGLPDGDGREFCVQLRRAGHPMPVIMITGQNAEADIVNGLAAGANDYLSKPFRIPELLARLRAQLRAFDNSDHAVFTFDRYVFRPSAKLLFDPTLNRKVNLTDKEVGILKLLYRAGGEPVTRKLLLDEIWGYHSDATTHTLETHIYRLRQKIEADATRCRLLMTEAGAYRLNLVAAE